MKQKIKSWSEVTVGQFIDLHSLSKQKDLDEIEKAEQTICILNDMTIRQVEELPISEFNRLSRVYNEIMTSASEMTNNDAKPKKIIQGLKGKYKIEYDPKKLVHRQFVEIQYFIENNFIENIHNIMASIVMPLNRFGAPKKNNSSQHSQISEDLLGAKIIDIYHSCVFFCKLYLNSLIHIRAYLVHQMMQQGATKDQATTLIDNSINVMAGSITQKNWLLLKV